MPQVDTRVALASPPSPDQPHLSPDSLRAASATPRQLETPVSDWAKPTFLRDKVTDIDRCLSTVTGLVQKQLDDGRQADPYSFFSKLTEVADAMKIDLEETWESIKEINTGVDNRFAELRQQIKADGKEVLAESVQSLRQQIKADQEEAIQQSVTKALGTSLKNLVANVDILNKDVRGVKAVLRDVESTSATVAGDLNTSLAHLRQELGLPADEGVTFRDVLIIPPPLPVNDDDAIQLRRPLSGLEVSTTSTIHRSVAGADISSVAAAYSETVQSSAQVLIGYDVPAIPAGPDVPAIPAGPDVPTTPTASGAPTVSDTSSVRTGRSLTFNEARTFLATLQGTAKLYGFLRNKRRA